MSDAPVVGRRIREWRHYRGMSVKTLADLAGLSAGFVSMVENGKRIVDRLSHLTAVAEALEVSVADLQGYPDAPVSPEHSMALATVPRLRSALAQVELGGDHESARSMVQLDIAVRQAVRLRAACDYAMLGQMLPNLLVDLNAIVRARGRDHAHAQRLYLETAHATTFMLTYLRFPDLALTAARQCHQAALHLGDPLWTAVAEFVRLHSLPPDLRSQTSSLAVAAADQVRSHLDDPAAQQVYGMLHLTAAWAFAIAADSSQVKTHLDEAAPLADRLGDNPTGGFANMWFGATNVAFWRAALAVEMGDGGRVGEISRGIHPEAVPSKSRQASFYTAMGRGLAQDRRDSEAVAYLLRAEHTAPQRVRTNPAVRETVASLLRRARSRAGGPQLRRLASICGLT